MILLSACTTSIPAVVSTQTALPAPTETYYPTATPTQTLTPTITPSPTPYVPFTVTASLDNLLLRTNPGMVFPAIWQMPAGTPLLVLGRSPGSEWLFVKDPNNYTGWVYAYLVTSAYDLYDVPIRPVQNAVLINGRIVDVNGMPLTDIGFTIFTGAGDDPPQVAVVTDRNGEFFAFLPPDSVGLWTVVYSGYRCESNIVDANCNCKPPFCSTPDPQALDVMLPQTQPLLFIWR